ncbi:MAG: adenylosuccinate lyase [Saprospiraceae bacterium]|nr:adenylosuccinate lyase [Saprospiraceae bacterium]
MLKAISPVDGRYAEKTIDLQQYFSEYALIRYRVFIEIEYLKALAATGIPQLENLRLITVELDNIISQFGDKDALAIKEIEKTTNHDVKAVEYFIRESLTEKGLSSSLEFIHFGLTSQDINNTAFPLMMKEAMQHVMEPAMAKTIVAISELADKYPNIPMLAHTHGQPASPTSFKKEMYVFLERLEVQISQLKSIEYKAKFGGATGNFNAHKLTFPGTDWKKFSDNFVAGLGLERQQYTTQISHYDGEAALFHNLMRINTILVDFCRDIWTYISMDYLSQKAIANEVGSSAMPHKVNPIDFENAEGNLLFANAVLGFLADKLPVSRLQRDLTDSTVMRNVGVPMAHILISLKSIVKGLSKLSLNQVKIQKDLDANFAVIAEGIQSILRREGVDHPYELLKKFTRGNAHITQNSFISFIDSLPVSEEVKNELKVLTPSTYTGYIL